VKEVYQYVHFGECQWNERAKEVVVHLCNTYDFLSLSDFYLRWQVVVDGVEWSADSLALEAVMPDDSAQVALKLPRALKAQNLVKQGQELLLNVDVCLKESTSWAQAGHSVAAHQYTLLSADRTQHPGKMKGKVDYQV